MLGIVYLLLAFRLGYRLIRKYLHDSLRGGLAEWWTIPASFLVGTLFMTWLTYLVAFIFSGTGSGVFYANAIIIPVFVVIEVITNRWGDVLKVRLRKFAGEIFFHRTEVVALIGVTILSSLIAFRSFRIEAGRVYVGLSVFSDFRPNLALVRSFSVGNNFPTEYPYFPAGDIRYHFLFQFLVGNLEFLGLPLDWALNLPSILSLVSFSMLLFALAVEISGVRAVGLLTVILLWFRSSFAFFDFVWQSSSFGELVGKLSTNQGFVGRTLHEDWGLWNQNVFANQRHLSFAMGIFLVILIVLIKADLAVVTPKRWWRFWEKPQWCWPRVIFLGVLLGLTTYWNAAVVLGGMTIIALLSFFSPHKGHYWAILLLALGLGWAQKRFFVGVGQVMVPEVVIGFLAKGGSLTQILTYYLDLLGIMPILAILGGVVLGRKSLRLFIAFLMPVLLATTVKLTPEIAVNHKYVFVAISLLNIFVAVFLYRLFSRRRLWPMTVGFLLLLGLTATGIFDLWTFYRINTPERSFVFRSDHPITRWIVENTEPEAIILTSPHETFPMILGGRKIFYGWPYYAWGSGYDTLAREAVARNIFGGGDISEKRLLIKQNKISYIVIDDNLRRDTHFNYKPNEEIIAASFPLVFTYPEYNTKIYKTD